MFIKSYQWHSCAELSEKMSLSRETVAKYPPPSQNVSSCGLLSCQHGIEKEEQYPWEGDADGFGGVGGGHRSSLHAITRGKQFYFPNLGRIGDTNEALPLVFGKMNGNHFFVTNYVCSFLYLLSPFLSSSLNKRPMDIKWAAVEMQNKLNKQKNLTAY